MSLKDETLRGYFINRPDSPYFESDVFKNVLHFLQTQTNKGRLKQAGRLFVLVVSDVKSMEQMHSFLERMHKAVVQKPAAVS